MANRTLRRPYNGTSGNASTDTDTDGSVARSEQERVSGEQDVDSKPNGNGDIGESDINGSGSVRYVEIEPDKLGEYIDSNRNSDGNSDGDRTRKRRTDAGKPRGKRSRKATAQETIEPFLIMVHQWAAVFTKCPEIVLDETEAKKLNDAYATFCEYHEIPILSPKRMSEINMVAALMIVYGPRVVAIRNRIKEENKVKHAKNITPIAAVN